jgi:hypothetical protein
MKIKKFCGPHSAHSMGGLATAAKMTPEQRSERARRAAAAWEQQKREKKAA